MASKDRSVIASLYRPHSALPRSHQLKVLGFEEEQQDRRPLSATGLGEGRARGGAAAADSDGEGSGSRCDGRGSMLVANEDKLINYARGVNRFPMSAEKVANATAAAVAGAGGRSASARKAGRPTDRQTDSASETDRNTAPIPKTGKMAECHWSRRVDTSKEDAEKLRLAKKCGIAGGRA